MGTVNPATRTVAQRWHVVYIPSSDIDPDRFWLSSAGSRSALESRTAEAKFDLKKGLARPRSPGVMSACFGYDLDRGAPLKALTLMSSGNRTQLTYQDARAGQSHVFKRACCDFGAAVDFLSP